ncbi:MAG: hypothetical protein K8F30_09335 [Taibaiella sp.]|nr:hypothetical protein [Taibaiella sp.]
MAERPVFVPTEKGASLVHAVPISFNWHPGMAPSQKKRNIEALHENASQRGLSPLLEISSKSEFEAGQKLSAFSLKFEIQGKQTTLECVFQGSKVFEHGGPYTDLYWVDSRDAKRDPRLKNSGRLVGFRLEGKDYPLSPATAFYDWLYAKALLPHRSWLTRLQQCAGFTDIEFNPERSVNCQAQSCATFVALEKRGQLDDAMQSFEKFRSYLQVSRI